MLTTPIPSSEELLAVAMNTVDFGPETRAQAQEAFQLVHDLEHAAEVVRQRAAYVEDAARKSRRTGIDSLLSPLGEVQGGGTALDVAIAVFCEKRATVQARLLEFGFINKR